MSAFSAQLNNGTKKVLSIYILVARLPERKGIWFNLLGFDSNTNSKQIVEMGKTGKSVASFSLLPTTCNPL